jgi:tetratricopeptide (TPR) repeat protein
MMMPATRLFKRSLFTLVASAMMLAAPLPAAAQDPGEAYLSALAAIRANQNDRAREALGPVQGDETWDLIKRSTLALADGDVDGARGAAQEAVNKNGDSPWTHFQLGVVAYRQNDWELSANECARAAELKGDLAYAHYYAGLAFQKQHNSAKASEHLHQFLNLAPNAPERAAVNAVIRTLG